MNLPMTASMPNAIRCVVVIIMIMIIIIINLPPPSLRPVLNQMHSTYIAFHLEFLYGVTEAGGYVLGLNSHRFDVSAAFPGIFAAFVNSVNVTHYSIWYGIYVYTIYVTLLCLFSLVSYLKSLI
jgi:hypothetical protein